MTGAAGANLALVWEGIKAAYQQHRIGYEYTEIKEPMYYKSANAFPCLKGQAAKVKDCLKPLLEVCQVHLDQSIKQHKEIVMALKTLVIIEETLEKHGSDYILPPSSIARL